MINNITAVEVVEVDLLAAVAAGAVVVEAVVGPVVEVAEVLLSHTARLEVAAQVLPSVVVEGAVVVMAAAPFVFRES